MRWWPRLNQRLPLHQRVESVPGCSDAAHFLTGAGFSRNWGGWLADEAFEYLLGCQQVDDDIRALLWNHKGLGGFEAALSHLQSELDRQRDSASERRLAKLERAISEMFADMNRAFSAIESF